MVQIKGPDLSGLLTYVGTEVLERIKRRTPVSTGRAQSGWELTQNDNSSSTINNSVPYIGILEEGSSTQAPNGMVRVTLEEVPDIVHKYLQENQPK